MTARTLEQVWREDRLIRRLWSRLDPDGRQLLCLYTALADDPKARPETCPASLCPQWLAYLLPWIDDAPADDDWPVIVARVVRLAPRFQEIRPRVEWQVRAACVREAMTHTDDAVTNSVCSRVADVCDRRGRDESVSSAELADAKAAASRSVASSAASWAASWTAAAAWAAAEEAAWAPEASSRLANRILDLIEADLADEGAT